MLTGRAPAARLPGALSQGLMPGFVSTLALAGLLLAAPPPEPPDAARAILARDGFQTRLPNEAARTEATDGPAWKGGPSGEVETASPPLAVPLPSPMLVLLVLAVFIAIALAFLLRSLPAPRTRPIEPPTASPRPGRARGGVVPDADALAREGRFTEAIHALLLRALAELGRRAGGTAPPAALTSREVLQSTTLAAEVRAALASIVAAVEWAHFGGRAAGRDEYEACLAEYRRFRDAWLSA